MDELKNRAGEKIGALHEAARVAANSSRTKYHDVVQQTSVTINKIREAFLAIWQNELMVQSRDRASAWWQEAASRLREGTLPVSPMVLYQELVALFKDHVWRRSMIIFVCGTMVGGSAGLIIGLRAAARTPSGPHARALHTQPDQSVILVDDAVSPGAGIGEVLVRVQAFSVSAADRGVLRGRAAALRSLLARSHVTVGRGFAGVVLDVGPGVTELELGDEVWGCVSEWSGGAANELLVIRSTRVAKRPRSLAADAAASLPWAGALALTALDRLRYAPNNCKGKRVAVVGASSGEGCALLQILSGWGVRCTAAAPRFLGPALRKMGAYEVVEMEGVNALAAASWLQLEAAASRAGPWDAVLACAGPGAPPAPLPGPTVLLKATAPRSAMVELRPKPFLTDRLPLPAWLVFCTTFYTFRILRWFVGGGWNCDWLEGRYHLTPGLDTITMLVNAGQLSPVLDKVYPPQDFEAALAHACGDNAMGTTVVRFP